MFVLLFAFIALSLGRSVDFALHYELACHTENITYRCEGKASSSEIQTRISGRGEVHTNVKKMIGSISHWKLHGVFDPKTNKGTEVGEVTFGVHTTHGDNSIIYHGAVISAEPNAHNHKQVDSAGWMKITGGKGSMKGATGGASHSCTFKVEHNKVHCFMVGNIVLP